MHNIHLYIYPRRIRVTATVTFSATKLRFASFKRAQSLEFDTPTL